MKKSINTLDPIKGKMEGMNTLAMSMALPHEYKAQRFPSIPVCLTSTVDLMSNKSVEVPSIGNKRFVLTRDPCFPAWCDQLVANAHVGLEANGSFTIPATANTDLGTPDFFAANGVVNAGSTLDGVPLTLTGALDQLLVLGKHAAQVYIYTPPNAKLSIWCDTGNDQTGKTLIFDVEYYRNGELDVCTLAGAGYNGGFSFVGTPGTATAAYGQVFDGIIPYSFWRIKSMRTGSVAPTVTANPSLLAGWSTGSDQAAGVIANATITAFLPMFQPPEFQNTTVPYTRTRTTASALLLSNVTAVLNKEGTVLAARLKNASVEMYDFSETSISSTHPKLRYFGPLEKGVYTFTTPGELDTAFVDAWTASATPGSVGRYSSARPLFHFSNVGLYNAMILTDYSGGASVMAASVFSHLEFESVSALFAPSVSSYTIEQLHAAEVALMNFGHFHENPLHWAAIQKAAATALRVVGPMVAPVVERYGKQALKATIKYLSPKQPPPAKPSAVVRGMKQKPLVKPQRAAPKRR